MTRPALAPLRLRPFRRLLGAYSVNALGDWVGEIALSLLVLHMTGSVLAVTAVWVLGASSRRCWRRWRSASSSEPRYGARFPACTPPRRLCSPLSPSPRPPRRPRARARTRLRRRRSGRQRTRPDEGRPGRGDPPRRPAARGERAARHRVHGHARRGSPRRRRGRRARRSPGRARARRGLLRARRSRPRARRGDRGPAGRRARRGRLPSAARRPPPRARPSAPVPAPTDARRRRRSRRRLPRADHPGRADVRHADAAGAGADLVVAHLGITSGAATEATLTEVVARLRTFTDALGDREVHLLCHGGPLDTPEAVRHVLAHCPGVAGSFGASTIERAPIERAVREATAAYKR